MNDHDDTTIKSAEVLVDAGNGHALARAEDGRLLHVVTPEHAAEHHPNIVGSAEVVRLRRSTGPARVATNAYRAGYDRIFAKSPVGEA